MAGVFRNQILLDLIYRILECCISIACECKTDVINFLMLRIDYRAKNYLKLAARWNSNRQSPSNLYCPISCIDKPALRISDILVVHERSVEARDYCVNR
jgi:hypothetical protein